jgi:predicted DNA binding CopG/RHH family protein
MSKTKMKRTNLYLTEKQHDQVSKEAEERGINFSEMFRKIIDNYLEREK